MSDERLEGDLRDALRARGAGPCPGEDALLAFYGAGAYEEEGDAIREHLARCAACVELARDARRFAEAMQAGDDPARPASRVAPWLAAAAVLAAVLAGWLWLARRGPRPKVPVPAAATTPGMLENRWRDLPVAAAEYRIAPEDELVYRSGGDAAGFARAMDPYARRDYAGASGELGRFLAAHPGHPEASFYRGVSLLMLGRSEEARPLLAAASASGRAPADTRWYLALAMLKDGDTAAALPELRAVAGKPGPHAADAERLAVSIEGKSDAR